MDLKARKDALRRLVLARRAALDPAERDARAATLTERVLGMAEVAAGDPVLAFVSFGSEVPTRMLLEAVLESGTKLLLPYVADDGQMRAAPVGSLKELEPGYRGILEPRARIPVQPSSAGVVVVPGVAFDDRGARLGYGGGFYDAFLRAAPGVLRIGICFDFQVVDEVPTGEHDERVDVVVTEERTLRARRRENPR